MSGTGFEPSTDLIVNGSGPLDVECEYPIADRDAPSTRSNTNINYHTPAGSGILGGGHREDCGDDDSTGRDKSSLLSGMDSSESPTQGAGINGESNSVQTSVQAWVDDQIWPRGPTLICETVTEGGLWFRENGIITVFDSIGMRFPDHVPPADTLHQGLLIDESDTPDGDLAPSSLKAPA